MVSHRPLRRYRLSKTEVVSWFDTEQDPDVVEATDLNALFFIIGAWLQDQCAARAACLHGQLARFAESLPAPGTAQRRQCAGGSPCCCIAVSEPHASPPPPPGCFPAGSPSDTKELQLLGAPNVKTGTNVVIEIDAPDVSLTKPWCMGELLPAVARPENGLALATLRSRRGSLSCASQPAARPLASWLPLTRLPHPLPPPSLPLAPNRPTWLPPTPSP